MLVCNRKRAFLCACGSQYYKNICHIKEKKIKIRKKLQNVLIFEKRYGKIKSTIKTGVILSMNKKLISVVVLICMLFSTLPLVSYAAQDTTVFLSAKVFENNAGTWTVAARDAGSFGYILRATGGEKPQNSKNAVVKIEVPADGDYFVFARTRDYKADVDKQGKEIKASVRLFKLSVGGTLFEKSLGGHGADGWAWEQAGKVSLKKGETTVEVVDSAANYARVEAIVLSTNEKISLPNSASELESAYKTYAPKIIESTEDNTQKPEKVEINKNLPKGEKPQTVSSFFFGASSFDGHLGTWLSPGKDGSEQPVLRSAGGRKPENTKNAIAAFDVKQAGTYYLWAWTRDYADGARTFGIVVDGKQTERPLGAHGENGWAWEYCGAVDLSAKTTQLEVKDTSNNYGRLQGAILTNDPTYIPTASSFASASLVAANKSATYAESEITGLIADPNTPEAEFTFDEKETYIVVTPSDFKAEKLGSWQLSTVTMSSILPEIMLSASDAKNHEDNPATVAVTVPKTGLYKVMAHTYDIEQNSGRRFLVSVGQTSAREVGAHGKNWKWESWEVPLVAGKNEVKVSDHTGNYGRFDMIVITSDLKLEITDSRGNLSALAEQAKNKPTSFETVKDENRPQDDIAVNLNGSYLKFDVPPVLMNDRTMVPFRAIFEALGCTVDWDDATQTAIGTRNGKEIRLTLGADEAKVDGQKTKLDAPAALINDRTLVPLRFVSEALGADVVWEDATQTVYIAGAIPPQMIMLTPESFYDTGTWQLEGVVSGSFDCGVLRGAAPSGGNAGPEDGDPSKTTPAKARFTVAKEGTFRVIAHCRDYTTSYPSARKFGISVDEKRVGGDLGTHGKNGFYWQEAGTISLSAGEHTLELLDTSGFYARCDMIVLTDNKAYEPSLMYNEMLSVAAPVKATAVETPIFPVYANENGDIIDETTLENGKTRVKFYKVNTSNGVVVQNEIFNLANGQWIKTKDRSEDLGFMVLRADEVSLGAQPQDRYVFSSSYLVNGKKSAYIGPELYKAGVTTWFVPTDYEVNGSSVRIKATNELGTITADWSLDDTDAPKVSVTGTFAQDGVYSIGAWEGGELSYDSIEFALAPFRVQGKRIPEEAGLYSEQYLFTPMGCLTLPEQNKYGNTKITKGVVVDPTFTELKWVKRSDASYGISVQGADGNLRGSVFAPVLGSDASKLSAGTPYTFTYRVISRAADWYDNYTFIARDLYNVNSYRKNTYSTLNQAIFNTRKYSMNDDFSGWDPLDKAYWNIESKNTTAVADPMEAIQTYLLTEDETYLEKRTLPTIVNFMTRGRLQFNSKGIEKSNGYVNAKDVPHSIGNFISCLNMNVKGGIFELTRGRVPYILKTGIEQTLDGKNVNGYSSQTPFSDDLYMYKYTGEKKYLDGAMQKADKYLTDVVYAPQTKPVDFAAFVYISYYPNIPALLDLYEASGEQKYLDAAHYAAKWLVTTLWVPGVDGDKKNQTMTVNSGIKYTSNGVHDWYGDTQRIVGKDNTKDYTETVENWVVSRVGLGLEQASTFYGNSSSTHMFMSMWVGDLLRIAKYTGDEYLANAAENAIVGRFSNYPGYYYGYIGFTSTQMKENYPYEGPDVTALYYHHIPAFMAMLEDFAVNQAFYRTDGKVNFPSVRESGYAYFTSNHYGFKPGNVYDLTDMWLWIAEDVLDSGNLQIDWVGARKDGTAAFVLMNQSDEDVTTTATLGEKVGAYNGAATVYDKDGNRSDIAVTDGKFNVTVPAKGVVTVAINADSVKAPAYAAFDYTLSGTDIKTESTCFDHGNGKAIVLQLTPENYYAYVYVTNKPAEVKEVKLIYTAGGESKEMTTSAYPYEFIVKVSDPTQSFKYDLELTGVDGKVTKVTGGTIKPLN